MIYSIIFFKSKSLEKDRKTIQKNKKHLEKVRNILQRLSCDPYQRSNLDIKKLSHPGEKGTFRLRVDPYRILYDIDTNNKVIIIYRIKQRKVGYK